MRTELEPDAEIPMLIDYMNSPLGPDNAIWGFYTGGGFYSGFVIDCDRTIAQSLAWAWFAPGSQWWGLPLAPLTALEDFLDDYLANPPACYDLATEPSRPPMSHAVESVSAGPEALPTVLIVDDDDGSPYEGYFKIPLGNLKKHYHVWDVQNEGSPPLDILGNYRAVVWFTGDADQNTLTGSDQANLAAYLDSGGKLFLSGQTIGQDISDTEFYSDYLHATLINHDTNIFQLSGNDILSGMEVSIYGSDGEPNQVSPSQIGLLDGASGVFSYDGPGERAWAGLRWEGDYQVVYLAFGFEGIGYWGAAAHRFGIMKKVFAWFDELPCPADIGLDGNADIHDFRLFADSMAGPDQTESPPGVDFTHFAKADLDLDEDVDLEDFADFQRRFGESCD
ncbi:MAG: hypothetical protein ACYTFA_09920 [Planctomycetota bacterium]